jgi:Fe-S cluster assembly protein SufD
VSTPAVPIVDPEIEAGGYVAAFERLASDGAPGWVQSIRRAAFDRFAAMGFPTTKNEDWHYTSPAPIAEQEWTLLTAASGDVRGEHLKPFTYGAADWHTMVFVNGRFAPELSRLTGLQAGVHAGDLRSAWTGATEVVDGIAQVAGYDAHPFTALNTAFMNDGAVLRVGKDVVVDHPIHLVYVTDATAAKAMLHPRTLIRVGRNARATIIESYVSTSDAAEGAKLHHYRIQREGLRAFHVGKVETHQARDSHLFSFSFAYGGALSRANIYTTLDGEGSGATLNGLYVIGGEQHCDHQTLIVHAQPNCYSRELYKGILDDRSHGVFNGKVYVHPIAQKTDGKQTNNTLLLSDTAHVDTKPQLEIFADDVKCTHGATVGQIDRTALFYLKSRGIDAARATQLLTYAFAADVLETLEVEEVRVALEELVMRRFTGVASSA